MLPFTLSYFFHVIFNTASIPQVLKNAINQIYKRFSEDANELLSLNKKEDYLEKCEDIKKICEIPTNFGHWYLGLLEMKKNLIKYCKCNKENKEKLHLAAQQMKNFNKMAYLCS